MVNPFIGAYWSSRKESRDECAQRAASFLQSLGDQPLLRNWHPKTKTRRDPPPQSLPLLPQELSKRFTTNNRDSDRTPILELGYSFSAWNGNHAMPASFAMTCGCYSRRVKNCATLALPGIASADADAIEEFGHLLELLVKAWEPDFGVATTMQTFAKPLVSVETVKGWFVYHTGGSVRRTPFSDAAAAGL